MHLAGFDPKTGEVIWEALCGIALNFNAVINLPLGRKVCKRCTSS
jgi:hypothetical protein